MQLRTFQDYGNTAPTNTFDRPVTLVSMDGYAAGAGYLQFFDLAATPEAGAVPMKTFRVAAAGPLVSIFYSMGPIEFKTGMWVGFSSTLATYTAVATSFSIHGEVEEFEVIRPYHEIKDATFDCAVDTDPITIWSSEYIKFGQYRLLEITVTNPENGSAWLMLLTAFQPDPVIWRAIPIGAGETLVLNFGEGVFPYNILTDPSSHAVSIPNGLYVMPSAAVFEVNLGPLSKKWPIFVKYALT